MREAKPRRRRTLGWGGLVILLLAAIWGLYRLFVGLTESGASVTANRFLLPALTFALVVLGLGMAGVLIRNLVRLILERKRGILGSRLRTKLVFFFLALVLVPAIILFSGSVQIIKQTVEAVVRSPFSDITRQSREIVDQWNAYFQSQCLARAEAIAEALEIAPSVRTIERLQRSWRLPGERSRIRVLDNGRDFADIDELSIGAQPALDQEFEGLLRSLVQQVDRGEERRTGITRFGGGLLAHAALRQTGPAGRRQVVVVSIMLPANLAENLDAIVMADQAYRQFRIQRRETVRLYLTLIALVFLVILFVATWIGFYVSRRITGPIQDLAGAAREISAGNLEVRVRTNAGDEMATLVDAFNEMAGELQESRAVITRSTADLRRSNRALEERRRYIETLLAQLSTAVISLDEGGAVTTANPATQHILGVRLTAGDDAAQVFRAQQLAPLAQLLEPGLDASGTGTRRDLEIQTSGGLQNLSVQISPLANSDGDRLGTLIMVEDLTELLRAQRASAWREIARRIAHEIKNPLTPIQLAAQRLRKKFFDDSPDLPRVLPEATESIVREVGALKQLVDEFSRFARMPELAPREFRFKEMVESVLVLYRGLPSVHWEVDLDPSIDRVYLDPQQMRRVFINLIDNAVAAIGPSGTIRIGARRMAGNGMLHMEIADSGPGIAAADKDKMFSPYFSTKKRGTGLGLAIVHKVITDHHGTIRVEDNKPHGARFVIEMPIRRTGA